ncbi:MAG: hypothetical protein GY842_15020 [bacterium]|nr:hypothetical protein [bacterium]
MAPGEVASSLVGDADSAEYCLSDAVLPLGVWFAVQAKRNVWYPRAMINGADGETVRTRCSLTKADAEDFRRRWELVNEAEHTELRATPYDVKLRQIAALMASVRALGWHDQLASEEDQARQRWTRLREVGHG